MTGKLNMIGLGGAGVNIVADVAKRLSKLEDGFSNVTHRFIDTTDKTIQAYPDLKEDFYKVEASSSLDNSMDGMAGERKNTSAANDMNMSVRKFLDKGLPQNKNDYYILVASASGGSGSVLLPLLLKAMLEKDYTIMVVVVGDSSNLLSLNNTINTLTSLQAIAKATKKAVSVVYYNNTFNGVTSPITEKKVNDKIFKMLSIVSMFVSGAIQNIDHQDMNNFFRPDKYASFRVAPGIYSLGVSLEELTDESTFIVRTIIHKTTDELKVTPVLLHNKVGTTTVDYEEFDTYPIFLMLRKGVLNMEVSYLKDEYEKIEKMKNSKYEDFDALDSADIDDSLGLVL